MALILKVEEPQAFKEAVESYIASGRIRTWILDEDGDITHANIRWKNKAWFNFQLREDGVAFGIIPSKKYGLTKEIYGVYHGRLAATLLTHFDTQIEELVINPELDPEIDIVV